MFSRRTKKRFSNAVLESAYHYRLQLSPLNLPVFGNTNDTIITASDNTQAAQKHSIHEDHHYF